MRYWLNSKATSSLHNHANVIMPESALLPQNNEPCLISFAELKKECAVLTWWCLAK